MRKLDCVGVGQVDSVLAKLETKFDDMSAEVSTRCALPTFTAQQSWGDADGRLCAVETLGSRIDSLEQNIAELMDGASTPEATPSKADSSV